MRYLILFCAAVFATFPACAAKEPPPPAPIQAMLKYCLPALAQGIPPADLATAANLPEFLPEQAIKFAPEGGRVFGVPASNDNAVLILNKNYFGVCSVAVRQIKVHSFWNGIDKGFGPETEFRMLREQRIDGESVTRREYEANINGLIAFIVSVSDSPRKGGMQALMTAARVDRKTPLRK